jgi:uncharacterized membrane protein
MKRIQSIDFVRGLVMVFMTLDHTRDFIHANPLGQNPTDLATTSPALFMTRWITHLCAPTFMFLAGTSAYLSMQNQASFSDSRQFLFTRGFWLIFVNFTINNFGIFFDIHFGVFFSQVIAAFGFGFIGLGLLLKLPVRTLGILGLIIIFGHDLFQGVSFPNNAPLNMIWTVFMGVNFFQVTPNHALLITYPIIPWLGIMLAGFGFGSILLQAGENRKKWVLQIGLGSLSLFILMRTYNIYGDVSPWSFQKEALFSFFSFINVSKYPPSLLFTLVTLGVSIVLLSFFDTLQNKFTDIVSVYGKVPLFYWLLHWYIIHFVAMAVYLTQGFHWSDLNFEGMGFGRPKEGGGLPLWGVHIAWLSIVAALYPVAKWYGNYKRAHPEKMLLRYL